eukprot:gene9097-1191_t
MSKTTAKKFNHKNYFIHFESIFTTPEIGKELHTFLKTEINEEPWLFLNEVKKFNTSKNKIHDALQIIEKYILRDSEFELNLSAASKKEILEEYEIQKNNEKWIFSSSPDDLFKGLFKSVSQELYHDSWKRFVRTKTCVEIMKKYQFDSTVVSPKTTENFSFDDDYFKHPYIFDRDFDFAESLFKDDFSWELIGKEVDGKMNSYYSNLNYLPNVSICKHMRCMKSECVLSVSFQRLVMSYSSVRSAPKSDPNITRIQFLDYKNKDELKRIYLEKGWENEFNTDREHATLKIDIAMPFPFNPRICFHGDSMIYKPKEKSLIVLSKPWIPKEYEYFKPIETEFQDKSGNINFKKVYPYFNYFLLKYQQIDEEKVLFSLVVLVDLGGWASNEELFIYAAKERSKKFTATLNSLLEEFPKDAKFEDYKEQMTEMKDGKYVDSFGKLIHELKIDEKNLINQ